MNKIVTGVLFCLFVTGIQAQTTKPVTVRQGESFTDHISLESDTKDMDIMVKFVFDEGANTLTVSLISYRSLFVFWANTRYKPVFKGRRLKPDMLPYEATYDPAAKYRLSKAYRRSIPRPRKKYVFKKWVEYEGLQPAPQEYKMISDYIEQTFEIQNKRTSVVVRLRDLMMIDKLEGKKKPQYEITYGKDLNLEYQVTIDRNPCSGLEEDLAGAQTVLEAVKKSYADISKKFGKGTVASSKQLAAFEEMKSLLLTQHVRKEMKSPCQDLQTVWAEYNAYIDSIQSMTCVVDSAFSAIKGKGLQGKKGDTPDARFLLVRARQIDVAVSRWLLSKDGLERSDLEHRCQQMISEVEKEIEKGGIRTPEQKKALDIFRAAERYYRKTCGGD